MSGQRLPSGRLRGRLRLPGSKSVTNRALAAAALAPGESVLIGALGSSDTQVFARALRSLGARVFTDAGTWRVVGPLRPPADREVFLDVGDAGTPARFLAALLSAVPGRFVLDGSPRMRARPMEPLLSALRERGARLECLGREGFLPLRIAGGALRGGRVRIRGDVSSQFLSALMLLSPLLPGGLKLDIEGPVSSASYLELTRRTIEDFSGRPGAGYRPARVQIPGDDSAACFPIAGAITSRGRVELLGLHRDSAQADAVFRDWAARAGGILTWEASPAGEEALVVEGPPSGGIRPLETDVDCAPDGSLPLAALLAFSTGTSVLTGVSRLSAKESDRLEAALDLLGRAGAAARRDSEPAGSPRLVIDGVKGRPRAAVFASHGDHRVAMAAAVLALTLPSGSSLDAPECVGKSWPLFWAQWRALVDLPPAGP